MQSNVTLANMNTLRMDIRTERLCLIESVPQLQKLIADGRLRRDKWFVLGGGSNVLFKTDFKGLILKMALRGIRIAEEDNDSVLLEVCAGEDWPELVDYVVSKGWGGIENLALVPGTAGAAPIQNIAAYGHNLSDTLTRVTAIDTRSGRRRRFTVDECQLSYRTSAFKQELKNQYIITAIDLRLAKRPRLNTSYRSRYESVEQELTTIARPPYNVSDVCRAIVNIRRRKLPDIAKVGSAGSIFKNPVVTREELQKIRRICPGLHYYPLDQLSYDHLGTEKSGIPPRVKIPAAWLIEDMGWAGRRMGPCGLWPTQPLNIVNYGGATPADFMALLDSIKDQVYKKYGVRLEPEIEIVS